MAPQLDPLFKPLKVGKHTLSNRLIMAPLTRFRAEDNHVQLPFVKDYYAQRACVPGTLLITEATFISEQAAGMKNVPGIYNDAQISAWKEIVDEIHAKGGIVYLQLWALGRAAMPDVMRDEFSLDVVGPSPLHFDSSRPAPRELTEKEIGQFVTDYASAARSAVEGAGFDGVEIHGANGYLIDQFLQDVSNHRTDGYGGLIEKRSRFGLEVARAVVDAVGADRTGIRLSPWSTFQGMKMEDPIPQFSHFIKGLKELKLAYLHVVESRITGSADTEPTGKNDFAVEIWGETSPLFIAGGFTPESAAKAVSEEYPGKDVAIVFGRYFISTPDLVYRIKHGIELVDYDRKTFYQPKSKAGYVDYPFSKQFLENPKL